MNEWMICIIVNVVAWAFFLLKLQDIEWKIEEERVKRHSMQMLLKDLECKVKRRMTR